MRRWGQIPVAKDDSWYLTTAKNVYRPDLYMAAAKSLVDEGKAPADAFPSDDSGIRKEQGKFIDGVTYDATKPNAYLASFTIGLKGAQKVTPAGVK